MLTVGPARNKNHKGGKVLSLSVIFGVAGLVLILVAAQLFAVINSRSSKALDIADPEVAATIAVPAPVTVTEDDANRLQPVAPKVESPTPLVFPRDYTVVWERLDAMAAIYAVRNANGVVTPEAHTQFITDLLKGFNYKAESNQGRIVSLVNGEPISRDTLLCYLNGYVQGKPYLKPSCPTY